MIGAADAVVFLSVKFERPDGSLMKPRQATFVAFRGVGLGPAQRLAEADERFGGMLVAPAA